jgi:PD-(D/E)XK nuclease superfamily
LACREGDRKDDHNAEIAEIAEKRRVGCAGHRRVGVFGQTEAKKSLTCFLHLARVVKDQLNALTESIIGAALEVHRELGPGLLENAYQTCLTVELLNR